MNLKDCETRHLYGSVYILNYLGKKQFVGKLGNKPFQLNVADLTPEELIAIAQEKINEKDHRRSS